MGPINLVQNDTKPWLPTGDGRGAWFVIDMGCTKEVCAFDIMNTDTEGHSTATFDILVSDDPRRDFKAVMSNCTLDADTDLVQHYKTYHARNFRYFKFIVQKARGDVGAGLRFISPKFFEPTPVPVVELPEPDPVVDPKILEKWQQETRRRQQRQFRLEARMYDERLRTFF